MKRKLEYSAGDLIAIPLKDGRWGVGIIARSSHRGILYCYFMPKASPEVPSCDDVAHYTASGALFSAKCGDLGLRQGRWKRICSMPDWRKDEWPLPRFAILYDSGEAGDMYFYDDKLKTVHVEHRVPAEKLSELPNAGLYGYLAMEAVLTKNLLELERQL